MFPTKQSIDRKRLEQIVRILAVYGLADWLGKELPTFVEKRLVARDGRSISDMTPAERLREAFTELGTTFIKLGQVLSTRPDVVGDEVAEELTKLQADVPADPPEVARETIVAELGKPPEQIFAEFTPTAMASASIAQVHAATLHDGTPVVVKVQHPSAEPHIRKDLDILLVLAAKAEELSEVARQYQPVAMTKEFRKNLLKEVDFRKELNNLEQVGTNLGEDARMRIPKPFREHSSARVLTMERFDGYSVGQVDRMEAEGVDRRKLAITFADAYVRMILRDGVYHADPHPGNVLVLSGDTLGLLDFGMVGRIDERTRDEYQGILLAAMFGGDAEETTDYILRICYLPRDLDRDVLRADVGEFMSEYLGQDLADLEIGPIAGSANEIMLRHKIVMPAGLSLLFKVLAQVEGTAQLMDLSFSMMEVLEPYYREHMKERLTPQRLFQRTRRQLQDWDRFLDALPRELLDMLVRARQGDLDLTLEHRSLDGIVNRLVLGVLGAALFLGSVQLWKLRVPPIWNDVPIPAMAGLLGSLYLGIRLLRAIKKTGDLGQRR
jgi:ubiquinone biosynthesis protein